MNSIDNAVNIKDCEELTEDALASGLVPFLHSSPGCGKSSIVKSIAKKCNLKLIDLRLSTIDSVDLSGMPMIDDKTKQVDWKPFDVFPLKNTPLPKDSKGNQMDGWLLFLDEFNSASEAVIAAAYNVVLDHRIGIYDLHPACFIACAGNREEDNAIVNNVGSAMTSRLVHLTLEPTVNDWIENVAIPQHYDFRIPAFLSLNTEAFMDFDPKKPTDTYSCPRTWEFVNKELEWFKQSDPKLEDLKRKLPLLKGTLNAGVAINFVQFCDVINDLPSFQSIVDDPKKAIVPSELSSLWAVTSMCLHKVDKTNFKNVLTYIKRLDDKAMKTLFVRGALKLDGSLLTLKPVRDFIDELSLDMGEINELVA